jgi:hypothetical protein
MSLLLRTAALVTGLFLARLPAPAQSVTVTGGTLVSALSPINHATTDGVYECIYLQGQLNQAGLITRLGFEKTDGAINTYLDGISIYLRHTSAVVFSAGLIDSSGYTRVFRGAFPNATASGYQEVLLSTPFPYNNVDNLSVLIIRRGGTSLSSTVGQRARYLYGNLSGRNPSRRYTGAAAITPATMLTASTILVNTRFTFGTGTATLGANLAGRPALYPNPASETTTLDAQLWIGNLSYSITDALGRIVRPQSVLPASGTATYPIPLTGLPPGTYHLFISNGEQRAVLRLGCR